jgi:hypothetical protein
LIPIYIGNGTTFPNARLVILSEIPVQFNVKDSVHLVAIALYAALVMDPDVDATCVHVCAVGVNAVVRVALIVV